MNIAIREIMVMATSIVCVISTTAPLITKFFKKLKEKKVNRRTKVRQEENRKNYSALCLIIRDENEYLKEWLDNHFAIGIDRIYIYDNGAKEAPVGRIVRSLQPEYQNRVTVVDWIGEYKNTQCEAYAHCLEHYGETVNWIGFIDTDEFIRLVEKK